MRFKSQYFKIFILTSLFWLLFVACLLMIHTDCISSRSLISCTSKTEEQLTKDEYTITTTFIYDTSPSLKTTQNEAPGELGQPVTFPSNLKREVSEMFKVNQFNLMASDIISVNRSLRDVRIPGCQTKNYPKEDLPDTSIIIVFHNEAWSTLIRTIWSIINRSPRHLIAEIILVDDASIRDFLGFQLEDYVAALPVTVKVERMKVRSGLVKARLKGASMAMGQVLTFLDAHCECSEGWLEPLLYEIFKDKTTVASPLIDVISDSTFEYIMGSDVTWGGFSWTLNFKWYQVPQREMKRRGMDRTIPIRTPVMAGGLFSIDKEYFYHIGSYDDQMDIWGGENLEISFRVWMCGGQLLIVTCSRVGHVFRKATPYTFPGGTGRIIDHNNARLAEVWMDEWKYFYYAIHPSSNKHMAGDVSKRQELRHKLQCKSFNWYLTNVFPESHLPFDYKFIGQIKNAETGLCLDTQGKNPAGFLHQSTCKKIHATQIFMMTRDDLVQNENSCLTERSKTDVVRLLPCHLSRSNQKWTYNKQTHVLRLGSTSNCLDGARNAVRKNFLFIAPCNASKSQQWILTSLSWRKE